MIGADGWRCAVLAAFFFLAGVLAAGTRAQPSAAALPRATATLAGAPIPIYSWARDHCSPSDTPDAPARAFRDSRGMMHLFMFGQESYAWVGPDLAHLRHDCRAVFRSLRNKDPARFADGMWLTSTYTADGRTVYALVHDEFHPWTPDSPPGLCPSREPHRCSYVTLVAATSINGGETFQVASSPTDVVAVSPYRYEPDAGFYGYMKPSNIIAMGGFYYVAFNAVPYRAQAGGVCLMRTRRR
jgi:hypothetical protein